LVEVKVSWRWFGRSVWQVTFDDGARILALVQADFPLTVWWMRACRYQLAQLLVSISKRAARAFLNCKCATESVEADSRSSLYWRTIMRPSLAIFCTIMRVAEGKESNLDSAKI
jgi:hypothetical protein